MIIYGPSETSNTHLSKGVIKIRFVFTFGFFSEDIMMPLIFSNFGAKLLSTHKNIIFRT